MSLKDTLKRNLPKELQDQVFDALGDDFDYDMVPRTRLNKVISQRNELRAALANQPTPTKGDDDDDDDDDEGSKTPSKGDSQTPPKGYVSKKEYDTVLENVKNQYEKDILNLRKQNIVLENLRAKGAIDPDTILKSNLINLDELTFDEKNNLTGVAEKIDALKKDKAYFFGATHERGTGKGGTDEDDEHGDLDSKLDAIFGQYGPVESND